MGMFDTVTFEDVEMLPKPNKVYQVDIPNNFQSKDFDCSMKEYFISKDRRLFKKHYKSVPCSEKEYEEYLKSIECLKDSFLYKFFKENGKNKNIFDYNEELPDIHGIFNIYDYVKSKNGKKEWYIQYKLKFTDGNLVDISLVEFYYK
jgi:hypothetical protein